MALAWVVNDEQSSLFARTDDGGLYRMQAEGWDHVEMPPVHAIAHDESGGFAALTVVDGEPKAYITQGDGGDHFHFRSFGVVVEAAPDAPASLTLAGMAVAAIVGDSGPLVSRGVDQPTTRHQEARPRLLRELPGDRPRRVDLRRHIQRGKPTTRRRCGCSTPRATSSR